MSLSVPQADMKDLIEIKEFPTELKLALKGLNNESRQKIFNRDPIRLFPNAMGIK